MTMTSKREEAQLKADAKKGKKHKKRGWRTAAESDRHELYEMAVQEPEADMDLVDQVWLELRGRMAASIREDFAGTSIAAIEWVKRRDVNTAIGVDLDTEVLGWAREKMSERLNEEQQNRLTLIEGNVLDVETDPVDSVLATNFSYYLFKTREELLRYFKGAFKNLKDDGIFLLDAYGGSDSVLEIEEERDLDGYTYIWDQSYYNPITGDAINHIHFAFPDGTRMEKAFTYAWRLWTLPEIRELLTEAGFKKITIYWEGTDEDGDGNGEWAATTRGDAAEGWIAYLAAEK
ncbi:MAG: class I SAM-dependent methyltransferase [Planctomycetota bacterium]